MFQSDIKGKVPQIYRRVTEFQTLAETEDKLFADLEKKANSFINNQWISSMDEAGVSRMEEYLGVTNVEGMDLDQRKGQILSLWNTHLPFTYPYLINNLDFILGKGNYTPHPNFKEYALEIEIPERIQKGMLNLLILVDMIRPMNLIWESVLHVYREDAYPDADTYVGIGYAKSTWKEFDIQYPEGDYTTARSTNLDIDINGFRYKEKFGSKFVIKQEAE